MCTYVFAFDRNYPDIYIYIFVSRRFILEDWINSGILFHYLKVISIFFSNSTFHFIGVSLLKMYHRYYINIFIWR